MVKSKNDECHHGRHKIFLGAVIFLIGLALSYGYAWSTILMALGALMVLKGILMSK